MKNFLNEFDDCQTCKVVLDTLFDRGYTLYADRFENYRYMIILQNPLYKKERQEQEKQESDNAKSLSERVKIHRRFFTEWFLAGGNRKFVKRFLNLLKDSDLIKFEDLKTYISHQFFEDFYVTDLVKYWAHTNELNNKILSHSLEHLTVEIERVKPDLIFSFSTRVWNQLYSLSDKFSLSPYSSWDKIIESSDKDREKQKLANVHGHLFTGKYENHDIFYVLPLFHLSSNARYNLLRDSYYQYFIEGLCDYLQIKRKQ